MHTCEEKPKYLHTEVCGEIKLYISLHVLSVLPRCEYIVTK